ncbi:MAG: glycosyltransferase family 2 protein [candidate division WOR-3 bacterium]
MNRQWQPKVSLVVVCRNEERTIEATLDSLWSQDYPAELVEVLIVDGMSTDRTREVINRVCRERARCRVRLLDNPLRIAPAGLNTGISAASGEVVFVMGAHARYSSNYISGAVDALARFGADAVGGAVLTVAGATTPLARAIARALGSRFGVGNSLMRVGVPEACEADTAAYAGYRQTVFQRVGLFDPRLVRNQDIEFNLRMRRAGMKIVVEPAIQSLYLARTTLSGLMRNAFDNGFWVVHGAQFSHRPFALRHLVPLGFVASLVVSGIAAAFVPGAGLLLSALAGSYLAADLFASLAGPKAPVQVRLWLLLVYPALHFSYGLGSIWAGLRWLAAFRLWPRAGRAVARSSS